MGRGIVSWFVLGCLVALAPAQAQAQDPYELETGLVGPIVWNLGGTLVVPLGDSESRSNVGGGFAIGLTYNPSPTGPVGIQFEYGADWSSLKTGKLQSAGINGNALLQYFNLNLAVHPVHAGRIGAYLIGGGGLYYRGVQVTRIEGTAVVPYCDPWLFYCSATPVTASSVIGTRTSWDWGLDGGLGLTFGVAPPVRLYLEVRYHYIFGPSFTTPSGQRKAADGQYLPITFGVRF